MYARSNILRIDHYFYTIAAYSSASGVSAMSREDGMTTTDVKSWTEPIDSRAEGGEFLSVYDLVGGWW